MCLMISFNPFIVESVVFMPTIRDVPDLMTDINTPATFTLVVGHNRPGYDLSRIRFQITSSDQRLLRNSQIILTGTGTNRIISALPTTTAGELRANAGQHTGANNA